LGKQIFLFLLKVETMSKSTTLKLVGEITDGSAQLLVEQLANVPEDQSIQLRIASPGASVFAGLRVLTALRERSGEIHTFNESLAASMASVIFALGTKRTVANGSRTMIHKPWAGSISGESNELRKQADLLDSLEKDLLGVYAKAIERRTVALSGGASSGDGIFSPRQAPWHSHK
jgi:ATP-dependent Clp protease protease subunit